MNKTLISKESVNNFLFIKEDVLSSKESKKLRINKLERAVLLGNAYHGKVRIFFRTIDSLTKIVETTVWALTGDYIALKGGVVIPVRAIEDIDFA